MPRLAASICMDAPPDAVFRALERPSPQLLPPGGPRVELLDPASGEGARYRWEIRRFGLHYQLDSVVTAYKLGQHIAWRATHGWEMAAEVTLWPEKGGTCLIFGISYRLPVLLRWLVPGPLIRLGVWHALRQIKREAESQPSAPAFT